MSQKAIRLPSELWEEIDKIAEYEQRDRSNWIRMVIREAVENYDVGAGAVKRQRRPE